MERRRLGRTGHHSSLAILGGAACWAATTEEAGAWLQLARDRGVNHLDIAPQYGAAEAVVGPHLAACRTDMFIAGKTLRASPEGVLDQFDTTRRLLNCEVLDLYQAHAVTSLDELERRSGALERIVQLRDRGRTRFAGITGHDMEAPVAFWRLSGASISTPSCSRCIPPSGHGPPIGSPLRSCWRCARNETSA